MEFQTIVNKAGPLSSTEECACRRTIEKIKSVLVKHGYSFNDAKKVSDPYALTESRHFVRDSVSYSLFLQGSYGNDTNVKQDSDIDIAFVASNLIYQGNGSINDIIAKRSLDLLKIRLFNIFKEEAYEVTMGNKCINIKFSKIDDGYYYKDADLVVAGKSIYQEGIWILSKKQGVIINFPSLVQKNSKDLNIATYGYYKMMVRILKVVKNLMEDDGYESARNVSSFCLESLVFNVDTTTYFTGSTKKDIALNVIYKIKQLLESKPYSLQEPSKMKMIFSTSNNSVSGCKKLISWMATVINNMK